MGTYKRYSSCTLSFPTITHQAITADIAFELKSSFKACIVLGGVDWKVSSDTVVKPDSVDFGAVFERFRK